MKSNYLEGLRFSLFYDRERGIGSVTPKTTVDFQTLVNVYSSPHVQQTTVNILQAKTPEEKAYYKKMLPFITPSGVFSQRNKTSITHHNNRLVALDLDGLTKETAIDCKELLSHLDCVLLAAISPRQKGVKALILISDTIPLEHHYETLKINKTAICDALGISKYINNVDRAQFVICQPFFIAYDPDLRISVNPEPLQIKLVQYTPPIIERGKLSVSPPEAKTRIEKYLVSATSRLIEFFAGCPEGERHFSIIKVQSIASWIHYAPQLEQQLKTSLEMAVCDMYGGVKGAQSNNAIRTFQTAWNNAVNRDNKTIEQIISETSKTAAA